MRQMPIVAILLAVVSRCIGADDAITQYFEQMRQRNLFPLAESYAISRLAQTSLPRPRRIQFAIELSKTLARHAEYASEQQQDELWQQARTVIEEQRNREPGGPFDLLLAGQSAMIPAIAANWLKVECDLRPYDEPLSSRAQEQCLAAVDQLSAIERQLVTSPKESNKNAGGPGPTSHELRVLLHGVRLALGQSLRTRAELAPADSRQRNVDLVDAEQTARKLVGNADEPIQSQAKLLLADCARLKGDLDGAEKMLAALEKTPSNPEYDLTEEIAAERILILLDRHHGPNALEQTLQVRTKRRRMTGELWYLRTRALASMRDASKKDAELAKQLSAEAEITLQRCDEQVGGFWARRCRQLWDATQTAEKYGPELDALMQQARGDFLANRMESALSRYSRCERMAVVAGKQGLAFDLGYTRASILLNEKQYESGAVEFLRLSIDYPQNAKAAAAHLNGAYCLGRFYDEQRSQTRRDAYSTALDQQIERFADDPTAQEALFLKAQLEEQRLQPSVALPLYLRIDRSHPRSSEARAGASRCFEEIFNRLREQKLPADDFRKTALETISQFMGSQVSDQSTWSAPECEVALHLAALILTREPPEFEKADKLLSRVVKNASVVSVQDDQIDRWNRLRRRAETLRIVALTGQGHPDEGEQMIDSLAVAAPRDLVVVIERLGALIDTPSRPRQVQYTNLLFHAADRLFKQAGSISKEDQDRIDQAMGRAYLVSGQQSKALEIYEQMAAATAKDVNRQREIALLLATADGKEFASLTRQCWRRVEGLTKPGSPDWMIARLGSIQATIRLNETTEARKLLGVTKILYKDLGGPEIKDRFTTLEKKLNAEGDASGRRN